MVEGKAWEIAKKYYTEHCQPFLLRRNETLLQELYSKVEDAYLNDTPEPLQLPYTSLMEEPLCEVVHAYAKASGKIGRILILVPTFKWGQRLALNNREYGLHFDFKRGAGSMGGGLHALRLRDRLTPSELEDERGVRAGPLSAISGSLLFRGEQEETPVEEGYAFIQKWKSSELGWRVHTKRADMVILWGYDKSLIQSVLTAYADFLHAGKGPVFVVIDSKQT